MVTVEYHNSKVAALKSEIDIAKRSNKVLRQRHTEKDQIISSLKSRLEQAAVADQFYYQHEKVRATREYQLEAELATLTFELNAAEAKIAQLTKPNVFKRVWNWFFFFGEAA